MISLRNKSTEPVIWEKPLSEYISRVYQHDPAKYISSINQLDGFRSVLLNMTPTVECRNAIYQYFWQLERLEQRVKIGGETGVKLVFKWSDSLTGHKIAQGSSAFEKANVLFCLASILSSIGAKQDLNSLEGLKLAVLHQRVTSGLLASIHEKFGNSPFEDLGEEFLLVASKLMLAQSHEKTIKIAKRSNKDQRIIGQLYAEASKLYSGITSFIEKAPATGIHLEGENKGLILSKRSFYEAQAQFLNALECSKNEAIGEELAHLSVAVDCIRNINRKVLCKFSFYEKDFSDLDVEVAARFQKTKRLNEMVYYQKVPSEVPKCNTLEIVSPLGIETIFSTEQISKFTDVFASLLPFSFQTTINSFEEEKRKILESFAATFKKMTTEGANIFRHFEPSKFQKIFNEEFTLPSRLKSLKGELKKIEQKEGSFDTNLSTMYKMICNLKEEISAIEFSLQQEEMEYTNFVAQNPISCRQPSLSSKGVHFFSTVESLKSSVVQFENAYNEIQETWKKYQAFIFNMSNSDVLLSGQFLKDAAGVASEVAKTDLKQLESFLSEAKNIENCYSENLDRLKKILAEYKIDSKIGAVDLSSETAVAAFIHEELEAFSPMGEELKSLANKYKDLCTQFISSYNGYVEVVNSDTSDLRNQAYAKYELAFSEIKNLYPSLKTYAKSIESYVLVATNLKSQLSDFISLRRNERESINPGSANQTSSSRSVSQYQSNPPQSQYGSSSQNQPSSGFGNASQAFPYNPVNNPAYPTAYSQQMPTGYAYPYNQPHTHHQNLSQPQSNPMPTAGPMFNSSHENQGFPQANQHYYSGMPTSSNMANPVSPTNQNFTSINYQNQMSFMPESQSFYPNQQSFNGGVPSYAADTTTPTFNNYNGKNNSKKPSSSSNGSQYY